MIGTAIGAIGEGLVELGCAEDDLRGPLGWGVGGDVANTAVMAARAGADTRVCGRVGADALGRRLLGFWADSGVDLRAVRVDPGAPTGLYVNERTRTGHRFEYHRAGSAGSRLEPGDVTADFLDGLAVLHYSGITLSISAGAAEAAALAVAAARRAGARISFAVNHRAALHPDAHALGVATREADIVFASLDDAAAVLGAATEDAVVAALAGGSRREVVVTAGAGGAVVAAAGERHRVDAPPVEVVDAAGAGDALAGAYLAARVAGEPPVAALRRGVAAASLSCASAGCALSYPEASAVAALAGGLA